MKLFSRRKYGFLAILVFGLFCLCWNNVYLFHEPPRSRCKVDDLNRTASLALIYSHWRQGQLETGPPTNGSLVPAAPSNGSTSASSYQQHYFNLELSDRIGVGRTVPDTRHANCKNREFMVTPARSTSVIITFYNEATSALLRTISSVLTRTPSYLLKEIIVIDDCSSVQGELDFLNQTPLVKFHRNYVREEILA